MAKITGIGGVFFRCKDVKACIKHYTKAYGFMTNEYGALLAFLQGNNIAYTQWSPFPEDTDYFPKQQNVMLNFRVDDLVNFKTYLERKNVTITDEIESFEYGKFLHILDVNGNKIELWEPVDEVFTDLYKKNVVQDSVLTAIDLQCENPEDISQWYKDVLFDGENMLFNGVSILDKSDFSTKLSFKNESYSPSENGLALTFKTQLKQNSCELKKDGFGNKVGINS